MTNRSDSELDTLLQIEELYITSSEASYSSERKCVSPQLPSLPEKPKGEELKQLEKFVPSHRLNSRNVESIRPETIRKVSQIMGINYPVEKFLENNQKALKTMGISDKEAKAIAHIYSNPTIKWLTTQSNGFYSGHLYLPENQLLFIKSWKRRFCILITGALYWFESNQANQRALGCHPITHDLITGFQNVHKKWMIQVTFKEKNGKMEQEETFMVQCRNKDEANEWERAFRRAVPMTYRRPPSPTSKTVFIPTAPDRKQSLSAVLPTPRNSTEEPIQTPKRASYQYSYKKYNPDTNQFELHSELNLSMLPEIPSVSHFDVDFLLS